MHESRRDHITPVLSELGWERVEDMVRVNDLAVVRRLLNSDCPPDILRGMLVLCSAASVRKTRAAESRQLQLP